MCLHPLHAPKFPSHCFPSLPHPHLLKAPMPFRYEHLDDVTQAHMLSEVEMDVLRTTLFFDRWLSDRGEKDWTGLIRYAAELGTQAELAMELRKNQRLKTHEIAKKREGTTSFMKAVPSHAAELIAEREFNHYYCRALCLRAPRDRRTLRVVSGGMRVSDTESTTTPFVAPSEAAEMVKAFESLPPIKPKALVKFLRASRTASPLENTGFPALELGLSLKMV